MNRAKFRRDLRQSLEQIAFGPGYSERHRALAKGGGLEALARTVLAAMNAERPDGARRWWPGPHTLSPIVDWVTEPIEDLEHYVRGCSRVVQTGRDAVANWTPGNLFGARSRFRWLRAIDELDDDAKPETPADRRRRAREELERE